MVETLGAGRIKVYSLLAKRIIVAANKHSEVGIVVAAQMGASYARREVQGQPWGGWVADMRYKWCGCNYFYAFGV
ncbi:hypothetical protein PR003_g18553 [Phytophthora rubi]|uniref:Uncharacterized protein n=1 Tax=Phytophthora rubi TaxID=129364 RepID=A0A6A4E6E2_9STRA|nr:hypothetical protein PR003_g18553 [Phytophthora rubi]